MFELYVAILGSSTILAVVMALVVIYLEITKGLSGLAVAVNKLVGSKNLIMLELYGYATLFSWIALAIPWIDLFTISKWAHFENHNLRTYFGLISNNDANFYLFAVFFGVLGSKAALAFIDLAKLLRKGRVKCTPHGPFVSWSPE
ncbi:MAG: hypothetical protein KBD55_02025 [Candidatus Pacebacteria bacterium]|jgi:hypothetical protein|nr:hypothetical protein [Candidatus Paceibacterota bacterium]